MQIAIAVFAATLVNVVYLSLLPLKVGSRKAIEGVLFACFLQLLVQTRFLAINVLRVNCLNWVIYEE